MYGSSKEKQHEPVHEPFVIQMVRGHLCSKHIKATRELKLLMFALFYKAGDSIHNSDFYIVALVYMLSAPASMTPLSSSIQ